MNIDKINSDYLLSIKILTIINMTELICINLTYKSPHEDVENCMGLNSDGTVNSKFTLLSLKNLLTHNLDTINKLLEKSENITNIIPIGYDIVEIKINSPNVLKNLMDDNIVIKRDNINDTDEINPGDIYFSDEETNEERLNMINNLVNQSETQSIFNKNTDSETEFDSDNDDIIEDEKNSKSILNKYVNIIDERNSESDDNNDNNDNPSFESESDELNDFDV